MKYLYDFYSQIDIINAMLFYTIVIVLILFTWKKYSTKFITSSYAGVQRIHKDVKEIPRMGGLLLYVGMISCLFIKFDLDPLINSEIKPILKLILIYNLPLFIVSFVEDIKYNVSPYARLSAIILSSFLFIIYQPFGLPTIDIPFIGNYLSIPVVSIIFFTIAHAGYCNGMNLIDGSNGLAGMVIFTTLTCISIVSFLLNDLVILYIALLLISFVAIFLLFNYPWGSIFLGDSGAYLWGSVLASLTIMLYARNDIPTWGAVVFLFYPSIEMVFSVIRKKLQGKSPLHPDPDHLHLKLYFVIEKSVKRARVANDLVMPMISIIWLTPALIIPWVFTDAVLSIIAIILLTFIYFGFYWALPSRDSKKRYK